MKFSFHPLDFSRSNTRLKIIRFLLSHDAAMSEREIASVIRVSHMSVNRTMRDLAEINLVHCVSVGKAHLWRVNRKSYAFAAYSKLMEGISRIADPVEDLKRSIISILPKGLVCKATLFGSVAKGMAKAHSDIDLFILVGDKTARRKLMPAIDKLSRICLEKYGNRLAPYIATETELRRKRRLPVMAAVSQGIQLMPIMKGRS